MTTLSELLSPQRISSYQITTPHLSYHYAFTHFTKDLEQQFQHRIDHTQTLENMARILKGDKWNHSENLAIHFHQLRHPTPSFYKEALQHTKDIATKIKASHFTDIVQIGIGGSILGLKAIVHALSHLAPPLFTPHFISNIDPDSTEKILQSLDPKTTLFIAASKSGNTLEVTENIRFIRQWQEEAHLSQSDIKNSWIAVTCQGSNIDTPDFHEKCYITSEIGGRFSATSPIGLLMPLILFEASTIDRLLKGAHSIDQTLLNSTLTENITLLSATISCWYHSKCNYRSKAIIPYSDALYEFPKYIQQLDNESNGKHINIDKQPLPHPTSPAIITGVGTNAQHSFFQMLHQGTDIIPTEFIGFKTPFSTTDTGKQMHQKLQANLSAQMVALATGKANQNLNKNFPGDRPSTLLLAPRLSPESVGALISFYENTVVYQGLLWRLNSFDQEGVQLGKKLYKTTQDQSQDNPLLQSLLKETIS